MPDTFKESFKVAGGQLLDLMKKILHEGNVRRIVIKQDNRVIAEFPLTVGVIGTVAAPIMAAVGAIAAFMNECTIEVERGGPQTERTEGTGTERTERTGTEKTEQTGTERTEGTAAQGGTE